MNNPDHPRTLRNPAVRDHRIQLLLESHMKPLVRYTEALRATDRGRVPDFDPLDGGIRAQALFLLEKPGPMTDNSRVGRSGSGFISRDNDDPTADAIHKFMNKVGIPRDLTLLWNVVPWWNGLRRITAAEHRDGMRALLGRSIYCQS